MDVAEFIAHNWYHDDTVEGVERIRSLLAHPGIYFEGIPDNGLVLVYLTLSDTGLALLKNVKTPEGFRSGFTEKLLAHPGRHIYVFRMVKEGRVKVSDLRQLRTRIMIKHKAQSFHWHDNSTVILHSYRG